MTLRRFIARHRAAFAVLLGATLLLRLLVPSGFMPMLDDGRVLLAFCPSAAPAMPSAMPMPHHAGMAAMHHRGNGDGEPVGRHEAPCAYAGLGLSVLDAPAATLLAIAIAFAFVLALLLAERPLPPRPARLQPPLRAPPLPA